MNVVIYARYSCSNQREESIEGQLKVCYEFAKRNNYTVIGEYIDRAISGTTDNRPQFQKMIGDSKLKQFNGVLVYRLDRFSRNRYDSAIYKRKLAKNNVKVFSAMENITDDPNGVLMESIYEGMAEYYSKELSQKVTRGMDVNASKCQSNGGTIPLGFCIGKDRKYHINEDTAPIIVKIFEMYSTGNTMKQICDYLNERKYKTVKGNEFNKNSLHRMLTNKKYIGYYMYNGQEIKDGVPRIIDDDLFNKCQQIMQKNKKAPARARATEEYLLTTKLICGECNSEMVGISGNGKNGKKYCYYRCKNSSLHLCKKKSVSKDEIENAVINETKKVLTDKNITKIAKEIMKLLKKDLESDNLSYLKKQLKKNETEIANLLSVIEKGNITDIILERIAQKKKEKDEIEKQITIEKMRKPIVTEEMVKKFLVHFKEGNIDDIKYKRSLINVFVNQVIVYENRLTILYNLQDSQSDVLFNIDMVHQEGFEPPTFRFVAEHSIQLSYWCITIIITEN